MVTKRNISVRAAVVFSALAASIPAPVNAQLSDASDTNSDEEFEQESGFEQMPLPDLATLPMDPAYQVTVRTRRPISRDETQDGVEVDGESLRNSARPSTLEALSQENAGVYVSGRGALHGVANGASGGIHIRGLGGSPNSQVLVVEDGLPDYMSIFGHPIPDAYVPDLIQDALVIKGGDSVLYGSNAMGGVVVLRSRWLEEDGFEVSNDFAYGSYSTVRETASFLGRKDNLDLTAACHAMSSQGHRDGAGGDQVVGQLAARYRFGPNLRLSAKNKVVHLQGNDPGPVTHPHVDHWFDVWRNNTSLGLEWSPDPMRLTIKPFFNLGVHRLYDGFLSYDYIAGAVAEADVELHRSLDLVVGLSGQHIDGVIENRVEGEKRKVDGITEPAVYGQLTWRPVEPLSIVAGGRVFYDETNGETVFLYKAGARWDIVGGFYGRTRLAKNFRRPTIRELYLPYPTANPDLRPEHALNWDFGLGYASKHFEAGCTGYRTQADDMIRYFGAWPSAEVVNIDHMIIWGVEGLVELREMGPFTLRASGDFRDVGRYTRQNPRSKVDATAEATHSFGEHFISANITGEWVHGLYMANYGRDPMEDVFVMDFALRYRYTSPDRGIEVEPYVFLRNFLDRRYAYVEAYPMPGFNVLAGLKLGI